MSQLGDAYPEEEHEEGQGGDQGAPWWGQASVDQNTVCVSGFCERAPRESSDTCCDTCSRTGGTLHSATCDQMNPEARQAEGWPSRDDKDDHEDRDRERDGDRRRDRDRSRDRDDRKPASKRATKFILKEPDHKRSRRLTNGNMEDYLADAETHEKDAERKQFAPSTLASSNSRIRTWMKIKSMLIGAGRMQAQGEDETVETVKKIMAYFITDKCQSSNLYLSNILKLQVRRHGFLLPEVLAQAKDCERAAARSRGPAVGKEPLDFPQSSFASSVPRLNTVATWWFLRGDELEKANLEDVRATVAGRTALYIPQSKTDQDRSRDAWRHDAGVRRRGLQLVSCLRP